MLSRMALSTRLRDLDRRVLGPTASREAWGRQHGWSLFVLLGLAVLAVCAWAVATDRPAIVGMNLGFGVGFVVLGVVLRVRRGRPARQHR